MATTAILPQSSFYTAHPNSISQSHTDIIEYKGICGTLSPIPMAWPWLEIINLGSAYHCLNYDLQSQLKSAQKVLHFKYARIDGIIEMLVHSDSYTVQLAKLNFSDFNRVINFLLSSGLKPFLELGVRPKKIDATPDGFYFSSNQHMDIDLDTWEQMISNLLWHCVNYWGIQEVSTWRFELWKNHSSTSYSSIQNYIQYLAVTEQTIHTVVPGAQVGGPGINLGGLHVFDEFEQLLQSMKEKNCIPDFISAYLYPTCDTDCSYVGTRRHLRIKMLIRSNEATNINKTSNLQFISKKYFPNIPVYLTEFNSSVVPRTMINDSCYKSSFLVKTAIDLFNRVDAMGYWQFSDLEQEHQDANRIIFGGDGLVSRHGIQKCGYFAFWLLGKLYNTVIDRGTNHITTEGPRDTYSIICHNYKNLSDGYCTEYFRSNKKIPDSMLFENIQPLHFQYTLTPVSPGRYVIKKYTLNAQYGNLADKIAELNHLEFAHTAEEIEYLSRVCVPQELFSVAESSNTALTLEATLAPLEVVLLLIRKVSP